MADTAGSQPLRNDLIRLLAEAAEEPAFAEVARKRGWVRLSDVLDALREYDHEWDSPGARDMLAFLADRFSSVPEQEVDGG